MLSGCVVPPVGAHGGLDQPIRPVVTGVLPDVAGLRAEVVYTGAWQLRLANTTDQEVSVFDAGERPFLRIGPGGTLADFSSPTWYESNSPEGLGRSPADLPGAGPDFRLVANEPAWTWFDRRLRASPGALPREVAGSGERRRVGDWAIPIRLGD